MRADSIGKRGKGVERSGARKQSLHSANNKFDLVVSEKNHSQLGARVGSQV